MKVTQVNNSQPNFKNSYLTKPGTVDWLLNANPQLTGRLTKGLIRKGTNYDYFIFSSQDGALGSQVRTVLERFDAIVSEGFGEHSMESLMEFGEIVRSGRI